tara:strand:+ start:4456 stop:4746 length:291 start_codon:yes stop_codon:yes gene_type:complete
MDKTQEDIIIEHIEIVTNGIVTNMRPNNSYSSWKNTSKGLNYIKTDKPKFYLGVNMWLNITQNQLLGTEDNEILNLLKCEFSWVNNVLDIKKLINS